MLRNREMAAIQGFQRISKTPGAPECKTCSSRRRRLKYRRRHHLQTLSSHAIAGFCFAKKIHIFLRVAENRWMRFGRIDATEGRLGDDRDISRFPTIMVTSWTVAF